MLTQAFARALPAGAEGVVVNMLDQRVWSPTPHFLSYTLSKAGLWSLTQQFALALAPRIRVNGIGPGPALPSPRQSQAQFDRQAGSTPLRRGTSARTAPSNCGSARAPAGCGTCSSRRRCACCSRRRSRVNRRWPPW